MVKIYTPCYEITFSKKFNPDIPRIQRSVGFGAITVATFFLIISSAKVSNNDPEKSFHIALIIFACFLYLFGVLILKSQFEEKQSLSLYFKGLRKQPSSSFSAEESAPAPSAPAPSAPAPDDDQIIIAQIIDVTRPMEDDDLPSRKAYETPHIPGKKRNEHDVESNSQLSSLRTMKNCNSRDKKQVKVVTQICGHKYQCSTRRS